MLYPVTWVPPSDLTLGSVLSETIESNGSVSFGGAVASTFGFSGAQSIAFAPDGSHAYVRLIGGNVAVLNIDSGPNVTDSGTRIAVGATGTAYFGVDEIATDLTGTVLVHVPATTSGGNGYVALINPATNSLIGTIPIPNDQGGGGIAEVR